MGPALNYSLFCSHFQLILVLPLPTNSKFDIMLHGRYRTTLNLSLEERLSRALARFTTQLQRGVETSMRRPGASLGVIGLLSICALAISTYQGNLDVLHRRLPSKEITKEFKGIRILLEKHMPNKNYADPTSWKEMGTSDVTIAFKNTLNGGKNTKFEIITNDCRGVRTKELIGCVTKKPVSYLEVKSEDPYIIRMKCNGWFNSDRIINVTKSDPEQIKNMFIFMSDWKFQFADREKHEVSEEIMNTIADGKWPGANKDGRRLMVVNKLTCNCPAEAAHRNECRE